MARAQKWRVSGKVLGEFMERHGFNVLDVYDQTHVPPETLKRFRYNKGTDPRISNVIPLFNLLRKDKTTGIKNLEDMFEPISGAEFDAISLN